MIGTVERIDEPPNGSYRLPWVLRGVPHPWLGAAFATCGEAIAFQRSLYKCHRCGEIHREGSPAESACARLAETTRP